MPSVRHTPSSYQFVEGTEPSTPSSGIVELFAQSNTLKIKDDTGVVTDLAGGGGGGGAYEWTVKNTTGSTITKGTMVYYNTYDSGNTVPEVAVADSTSVDKARVMGFVKADITNGSTGAVVTEGELTGLDTSLYSERDLIYPSSSGGWTNTPGAYSRAAAIVLHSHASSGVIYVFPSMPVFELGNAGGGYQYRFGGSLASADTSLPISGMSFSAWYKYKIQVCGVMPASDGVDATVAFMNGGSDFASGTYKSGGFLWGLTLAVTAQQNRSGTTNVKYAENVGSTAGEGLWKIEFDLYKNDGATQIMDYRTTKVNNAGNVYTETGTLYYTGSTQADGIRLAFSSGNVASVAEYKVWALRAS